QRNMADPVEKPSYDITFNVKQIITNDTKSDIYLNNQTPKVEPGEPRYFGPDEVLTRLAIDSVILKNFDKAFTVDATQKLSIVKSTLIEGNYKFFYGPQANEFILFVPEVQ
ncbi:hypothetical protein H0H93_007159, partial [Arthromyces matolae]